MLKFCQVNNHPRGFFCHDVTRDEGMLGYLGRDGCISKRCPQETFLNSLRGATLQDVAQLGVLAVGKFN